MLDRKAQIARAHAALIHNAVAACQNPSLSQALAPMLKASEDNGWTDLVAAIRRILKGERDPRLLVGLDEEDATIVEAILRGLQDPTTLPDPNATADPSMAAPGLASMVHAAARGDLQASRWLGEMAEQMRRAGGDMARLGGILGRLTRGERDPEALTRGMGAQAEGLVLGLLEELARLESH
jgi:hypothetical protein